MCDKTITFNVPFNEQITMETVLHVACRQRDYELARMFLENGVDVNTQDVSAGDFDFNQLVQQLALQQISFP